MFTSSRHMYKKPLTDQIRPFTVIFITETYRLWTVGVFAYFKSSHVDVELYTLNIFGMFYEHDILFGEMDQIEVNPWGLLYN